MKITSYQLLDIQNAAYLPVLSHAVATEGTLYHGESVQQTPFEIFLQVSFDTWNNYHVTLHNHAFIK